LTRSSARPEARPGGARCRFGGLRRDTRALIDRSAALENWTVDDDDLIEAADLEAEARHLDLYEEYRNQ
jgi:hypothetical protein